MTFSTPLWVYRNSGIGTRFHIAGPVFHRLRNHVEDISRSVAMGDVRGERLRVCTCLYKATSIAVRICFICSSTGITGMDGEMIVIRRFRKSLS